MLKIKEILKEKGITGKDLAKELNITENAFSLIVNGKRQPRFELLAEIAKYLDVDIRELFVPTKEVGGVPIYIKDGDELKEVGEIKKGSV
ncbi:MAG: helix-turn-helix transcriptional regulator [Weeksellaceae bacterium]|nr:helix-turn-helix transcriptional regulator [Weeksellaceae bacterium]